MTHFAIVTLLGSSAVFAGSLPPPTGDPILTISGNLKNTNVDNTAVYDFEMLSALPSVTFSTSTIWTKSAIEFTGVSLLVLLEVTGADGDFLKATALNDYAVEIPISDAVENGPIVAYLMDGVEISVRSKGPLWIVYPYDANSDYRKEVIYARSIWQLDRIETVN